jgi:hypothetical protein
MTARRGLLICSLFVLALAGVRTAMAADPAPLTRTQIKLLTPFGPAGLSIGMAVTEKVNGNCFTGSLASPSRPDAWRCSSGNGILDPCYQRILGDEKQLACPVGGPWPANVVLLTLTQPLPSEPRKEISRENVLPWALELTNGMRCTMFTGAMPPGRRNAHQLWLSGRVPGGGRHRSQPADVAGVLSGGEVDCAGAGGRGGRVVLRAAIVAPASCRQSGRRPRPRSAGGTAALRRRRYG